LKSIQPGSIVARYGGSSATTVLRAADAGDAAMTGAHAAG
jgi:hypothetical protein